MTSDNQDRIPDSVNELLRQIAQGQAGPTSTVLPKFSFGASAGMLDFLVVIEQLVLTSGGVNLLQMMHACAWLTDACCRGLDESIESLSHDRSDDIGEIREALLRDKIRLDHCRGLLNELVAAPTYALGAKRAAELLANGHSSDNALRVLISKDVLEVLGIEPKAFDEAFIRRHENL